MPTPVLNVAASFLPTMLTDAVAQESLPVLSVTA